MPAVVQGHRHPKGLIIRVAELALVWALRQQWRGKLAGDGFVTDGSVTRTIASPHRADMLAASERAGERLTQQLYGRIPTAATTC